MAETSDSNTRPDLPSSGSPPNKDFWYSLYTSGGSDGGDGSNTNSTAAAGSSRLDYEWGHVLNKSRETKNKRRKKCVGGGSRSAVNSSSDLSEALSAISAHLSLSSSSGSGDKDEFFKRSLDFWTGTENFCPETEEWMLDEKMENRTRNNLTSDIHSLSSEGGDDDTLSSDSDDNGVQADLTCGVGEEMQKDGSQLPEVGMIFPSEEEAYNFYKIYAREIGFNVRKGKVQRLCNGSIRKRYFFCSRQGLKKQSNKITKYKRKETRTGCNAKIQFTVENGKWVISQFTQEHNHQLEGQSRNVGFCSKPTEVHPVVHLQNEAATEEDIGATEPAEFGFVDCRSHVLGKTTNGLNPVDAQRLVNGDGDETVSEKKTCIYSSMNELVHKALDFIAKSVADQKIQKTAEGILGKALAEIKDSLTPKGTEHFSTTDLEVRSEGNHHVQHQTPEEVPKAVFEVGSTGGLDPPLSLQKDVGIKIVDGSKGNKRNLEAVLGMQRGCNNESTRKKVRLCEKQAKISPNQVVLASQVGGVSSLQMDFGIRNGGQGKRRDMELVEAERAGSRASDDEEKGSARKELRLSKEQSAFLEESFKEDSSLNPIHSCRNMVQKQKLALAKQLNLRPRQVVVWFQSRRARTKLKQTEVDCEYLKRCCETLTEENRRLQKELQELRALKTSQPFYMQLPATTLTMCPSCERVASTTPAATAATTTSSSGTTGGTTTTTITNAVSSSAPAVPTALSLARPSTGMYPFSHAQQVHKSTAQARQAA